MIVYLFKEWEHAQTLEGTQTHRERERTSFSHFVPINMAASRNEPFEEAHKLSFKSKS